MMNALSRRSFLGAAGASAAVLSPRGAKGLTGSEIEARADGREVAEFGISMWDLDTPALLVDLDALEANVATMARTTAANGIAPAGTSSNLSRQNGSTDTAISISTVPDTAGVNTRRNCGSHVATAKKNNAETTIRLASMAGPPSASARIASAM